MNMFTRILFVFAMLCSPLAMAQQAQLPQFTISNIPTIEMEVDEANFDYDKVFNNLKNPMMRDVLRLQYQINLLERLIRRQTEIQRIAESYESIGLPFNQPSPPERVCEQLPVNVLCMAFYPDSKKYKELVAERQEEFRREQIRQMEQMVQNMASGTPMPASNNKNAGMVEAIQNSAMMSPEQKYLWSDIRCLSGRCSALLIDRTDANNRFRIRDGELLPNDLGKVSKISVSGVTAHYEGQKYNLQPEALASGQQVDVRPDTSQIANILRGNLGAEAENSAALQQQTQGAEAIPPQTLSGGSGAMLGVTGLF